MECYFFGTFNPPHLGHLKIANAVMEKFGFDKIIFVPSKVPPHKNEFISATHRFNMLKLLENKHFEVSDIELNLPSPSYSYQTIEKLLRNENEKLNFIIGYDAFIKIESWKNPDYIREKLHFIVLQRKGEKKEDIEKLKAKGYDFVIADSIPFVDISSTEIRDRIQKKLPLENLIDERVKRYIDENKLYGN